MERVLVLDLYRCVNHMLEKSNSVKFSLSLLKNKSLLETEVKNFEEASKALPEVEAYQKDRMILLAEYGEKLENGDIKVEGNQVKLQEGKEEEFNEKIKELNEKHNIDELDKKHLKHQEEVKELMGQDVSIDGLVAISADSLEENGITDRFCLETLFKCDLIG